MFTPFLIVSVAEAWQLGINKHLLRKWAPVCWHGRNTAQAWLVALGGYSGMSITRSSSPSRASSPLPVSLNIC